MKNYRIILSVLLAVIFAAALSGCAVEMERTFNPGRDSRIPARIPANVVWSIEAEDAEIVANDNRTIPRVLHNNAASNGKYVSQLNIGFVRFTFPDGFPEIEYDLHIGYASAVLSTVGFRVEKDGVWTDYYVNCPPTHSPGDFMPGVVTIPGVPSEGGYTIRTISESAMANVYMDFFYITRANPGESVSLVPANALWSIEAEDCTFNPPTGPRIIISKDASDGNFVSRLNNGSVEFTLPGNFPENEYDIHIGYFAAAGSTVGFTVVRAGGQQSDFYIYCAPTHTPENFIPGTVTLPMMTLGGGDTVRTIVDSTMANINMDFFYITPVIPGSITDLIPANASWSIEAEDCDFISGTALPRALITEGASGGKFVNGLERGAVRFTLPAGFTTGEYDIFAGYVYDERNVLGITVTSGATTTYYEISEATDNSGGFVPEELVFRKINLAAGNTVQTVVESQMANVGIDYFYLMTADPAGTASTSEKKSFWEVPSFSRGVFTPNNIGSNNTSNSPAAYNNNPWLYGWSAWQKTAAAGGYFSFNVSSVPAGDYSLYMYGYITNSGTTTGAWEGRVLRGTANYNNVLYSYPAANAYRGLELLLLSPRLTITTGNASDIRVATSLASNNTTGTTGASQSLTQLSCIVLGPSPIRINARDGTLFPGGSDPVRFVHTTNASDSSTTNQNVIADMNAARGHVEFTVPQTVTQGRHLVSFAMRHMYTGASNPGGLTASVRKAGETVFSAVVATDITWLSASAAFISGVPRFIVLQDELELGPGDTLRVQGANTGWIELNYLELIPRF
ncbi:MAG: hypothetical protein FWG89_07270 [Treponema sp.]|nr:hypothetical protein [Treponema sp.]